MIIDCFFFFFQAEDGIRDRDVTGVQTCALPIYYPARDPRNSRGRDPGHGMRPGRVDNLPQLVELWRREVLEEGRQDIVPDEQRMRRMLARFDWDTKSRVVEDGGGLAGAVLVMSRPSPEG